MPITLNTARSVAHLQYAERPARVDGAAPYRWWLLQACLLVFSSAITLSHAGTESGSGEGPTQTATPYLVPIGEGTARYAGFIPVYDAILYAEPQVEPDDILKPAVAKRLEIVYRIGLKADKMIMAAERTLARQHSEDELERWRSEVAALHASYRDVQHGDRYALVFQPADGLWLEFNGDKLATIPSAEFAQLYFGIWLGESPLSDRLRNALLNQQVQND